MRKTLMAATALVFTLPAMAQAGNFGFYAGAQVGGAFASIEEDSTSPIYDGGGTTAKSQAANGLIGGVFGGYGMALMQSYFIGGEVNATFGNRSFSYTITDPIYASENFQEKVKVGTEWGITVRPGYMLNEHALVYAALGFEQVPLKGNGSALVSVPYSKTQSAFAAGLGTEVSISGPLTFRADYTHTFLDNITIADSFGNSSVLKPSEDKIKLGIAYHF